MYTATNQSGKNLCTCDEYITEPPLLLDQCSLATMSRNVHKLHSACFLLTPILHLRAARYARAGMRHAHKMCLPTISAIRTADFPDTVTHAAKILGTHVKPPAENVELLRELLRTSAGARGVFVALLSDRSVPAADRTPLSDELVGLLRDAARDETTCENGAMRGFIVRELLVKNVVMSAAMVVTYGARGQDELRAASKETNIRAVRVLRACAGGPERELAKEMARALWSKGGTYEPFVRKWGYGEAERKAGIEALVEAVEDDIVINETE